MKGQYFSFDAIIGASIFILTLIAILSYWYGVSNSIEQQQTVYAKEAIRIADILYSPAEIPYGVTVNWSDKHIDLEKAQNLCGGGTSASAVLGSEYAVAIHFTDLEGSEIDCVWASILDDQDPTITAPADATEVYRMRRVGSYVNSEGNTTLGYVDIYVYNAYQKYEQAS